MYPIRFEFLQSPVFTLTFYNCIIIPFTELNQESQQMIEVEKSRETVDYILSGTALKSITC